MFQARSNVAAFWSGWWRHLPTGLLLALAVIYSVASYRYGLTFRNEHTIWLRTVERSPLKPRPRLNLALAQMERRQWHGAWQSLDVVDHLLAQSHLRTWDRRDGQDALVRHRLLLSRADPDNRR